MKIVSCSTFPIYIRLIGLSAEHIRVDTALMFDAVLLFAESLTTLGGKQFQTMSLQCSDTTSWRYGLSVLNTMSTVCVFVLILCSLFKRHLNRLVGNCRRINSYY